MFAALSWFIFMLLCSRGCTQNNGDLRLKQKNITDPAFTEGRLEIFLNGEWGTVCEDHFSAVDANVACHQLGYSGSIANPAAGFHTPHGKGEENQPIWLDDVGCADESGVHLLSCPNAGVGVHNCDHFSDISISCSPVALASSVRLNGYVYRSQGRLEVSCEEEWMPVCAQNVNIDKANEICKELGYTEVSSFQKKIQNSNLSSIHQLDDVSRCFSNFADCSCIDSNLCSEEVFIECTHTIPFGAIRFTNEILEIFINGAWRGICGDSFTEIDSNAVCSKLGYLRAESFSTKMQNDYLIWNKQSDCDLSVDQSFSCLSSPSQVSCSQNNLVTIKCTDDQLVTEEPTLRDNTQVSLENLIAICLGSVALLCYCCLFMIVCCTHLICGYYVDSKRDRLLLDTKSKTFTFMDSKFDSKFENDYKLKPKHAKPGLMQYSTPEAPHISVPRPTNSPYPFPQEIERIKLHCSQDSLLKETPPAALSPHEECNELERLAHQLEPPQELLRKDSLNLDPISEEEISLGMSEEQTIEVEFNNV